MIRCRRRWRWSKFRMWDSGEQFFPGLGWGRVRWRYDDEDPYEFYLMCEDPKEWESVRYEKLEQLLKNNTH